MAVIHKRKKQVKTSKETLCGKKAPREQVSIRWDDVTCKACKKEGGF